MSERPVRLGQREQQIVELLLQGCDNDEIARQLNMARRTVKAHFNRLFLRFGITSGIKRVKLATLLYRRQLCLEANATENGYPVNERAELLNLLPRDLKTKKSPTKSEPLNTSSRTISESSTTNSDSGIESSSPSGTKPADLSKSPELEPLEAWEHSVLGLSPASSSGTPHR
jgi:Bacterial regulatory proteins, luxR family